MFHHPYLKFIIHHHKMNRQSGESMVINSSIALLQERFRQLQRAREMREVKESLRLISESQQVGPTTSYNNILPTLFFHSELIIPTSQPHQSCSSFLQHNLQSKQTHLQVSETPPFANLWSADTIMHRSTNFDDSDVDTSLHL